MRTRAYVDNAHVATHTHTRARTPTSERERGGETEDRAKPDKNAPLNTIASARRTPQHSAERVRNFAHTQPQHVDDDDDDDDDAWPLAAGPPPPALRRARAR